MKTKLLLTLLTIMAFATSVALVKATPDTLQVTNLTGQTYTYTMPQITDMPQTNESAVLTCYGTLVTSGTWGGVELSYLLNQTGVNGNVASIIFYAADGYTVSIPINTAQSPQTIIAYEKDGQTLSEGLRLVLPGANGASWIAQITSITMSDRQVSPPPPVNPGLSNDAITNIQNTFKPQSTASPTIIPTPTPTPTSNPTPTAPPTSSPTITSTQPPPQTSISQVTTNYLLPTAAILIIAAALAIPIYRWQQKNSLKPKA